MSNFISEAQIERALVQKLQHLHGFDALDCHTEDPEDLNDGSGRANKREVILVDRVMGVIGLFLVAVDADALGEALRWEPSRNDELFPHLYGELDLGAVTAILDLPARSDGTHEIPELAS